ncbi:MAG TPA: NUDIX hydrolase [Mycobacteriales bacterium]
MDLTWRTFPAAGALVVRPGAEPGGDLLLMVRQARAGGVRWEVPGGNQEAAESFEEVAAREVAEECGLAVTVSELVATYLLVRPSVRRSGLGAFFAATADDPAAEPRTQVPDEILETAYLDPLTIPPDELGPVTGIVVARWWPRRREAAGTPFHVAVRRAGNRYVELPQVST